MLSYNDLYEILRREKFNEALQLLQVDFIEQLSAYLSDKKEQSNMDDGMFQESGIKNKKQYENSVAIFKELILRRKKKILNLVFVATETGIMKRDYENMLQHEREMFDSIVKVCESADKSMTRSLQGVKEVGAVNRMILFNNDVEQFVDMNGNNVGPFMTGELANLDSAVSEILVSSGKARFVDEK